MIDPELTPEYLTHLLANGYTDEVRAFTRRLRSKPNLVMALERVFDDLVSDATIGWEGTPWQEDFFLRAEHSLEEMETFLAATPQPYASFVVVLNHGPEVTVEIGWQDRATGQVVWDRWTTEVDDPVMAFANIGFLFDARDYRWEAKETEAVEPPLYRYHPERFRAYRDYAGDIGSLYRGQVDPIAGMLTIEQLNAIKLPYASQYLYFGPQDNLQLEPGWPIDGAYVESRGPAGDIRFTVTTVPHDHGLSRLWYLLPEVQYTQDFVSDFRLMDLATATDMALSDDRAELHRRQGNTGGDITENLKHEFDRDGEPFPDDLRIEDISPKLASERLSASTRRHPVYRAALRLVVNALCYVAAYPDDIDTAWPDGTPPRLQRKVLLGKGKEQKRARSKLEALGYIPVHICGQQLASQIGTHVSPATGLRHVTTHWRRGHWRNQAFGPVRSLRKLIWVMPVRVGLRGAEEDDTGHLYLVS